MNGYPRAKKTRTTDRRGNLVYPVRLTGRLLFPTLTTLCIVLGLGMPVASPTHAAADTALPICLGSNDLLVDQSEVTVVGGSYGEICVVRHGILHLGSVSVGTIYIDGTGTISADGTPGGTSADTDCAPSGTETPAGADGGEISINARTAVIEGTITANGGAGLDAADNCDDIDGNPPYGGMGGAGGSIILTAGTLTLDGKIEADGGKGGDERGVLHEGGAGGSISISAGTPRDPSLGTHLSVTPGMDTDGKRRAKVGPITLGPLTAAQQAELPQAPPALVQVVGSAPTILPVQPETAFTKSMECVAGDLNVPAGTTIKLGGMHTYQHVCVDGLLKVQGHLKLIAQTVRIGPKGAIRANGVAPDASGAPSCDPNRSAPQAGAAGNPGMDTENGGGFSSSGGSGGAGGGVVMIVARRVAIAGRVSADGATGGYGMDDIPGSPTAGDIPPTMGGGGGNGGGITIVAGDLQITGALAATGGRGGEDGADYSGAEILYAEQGRPGCIRLLSSTLRIESRQLALPESLVYGKRLPTDPVPPSTVPDSRYSQVTLHTISAPFLAFRQKHGGTIIFGEPLSEPFTEGEQTVQYFERARLVRRGTTVTISPIGRLVTAGRTFKAVAPVANTAGRRYFPTTKHTLSGRFLAFWKQHQGSMLFGAPISEPLKEMTGDGTGRIYLVQYFADARMEYHPEIKNPSSQVELGRLGYEYLQQHGLL